MPVPGTRDAASSPGRFLPRRALRRRVSGSAVPVLPVLAAALTAGLVVTVAACVPTGSAPPHDGGAPAPSASSLTRPSVNVMTEVFEDTFDRPDGGEIALGDAATGDGGTAEVKLLPKPGEAGTDAQPGAQADGQAEGGDGDGGLLAKLFDAGDLGDAEARQKPIANGLGPNWSTSRPTAWRVENGRLCGEGAHNRGVWLNKVLPVNARIEFDAIATTDQGDLKAEVWGDGHSYATSTSYTNATSYLTILGGWKNTIHALARLNEHGTDRKEIHVDKDSDDPRQRAIVKGQVYRFKIERTDGITVRFSVDGLEYLSFKDPAPLGGFGHDHLGFNEWEAKTCYDNVKVTPL